MRLTRSPPDYNWATFGPFLLRLCQRVIVKDVLIKTAPSRPRAVLGKHGGPAPAPPRLIGGGSMVLSI